MLKKTFALLLAISFMLLLAACSPNQQETEQLDWTLYGVWFENGEMGASTSQFSLSGKVPTNCEVREYVTLELQFVWPKELPYVSTEDDMFSAWANFNNETGDPRSFICCGYVGTGDFVIFCLYPDDEYIVFCWADRYLVASTDPNADFTALYTRFDSKDRGDIHIAGS